MSNRTLCPAIVFLNILYKLVHCARYSYVRNKKIVKWGHRARAQWAYIAKTDWKRKFADFCSAEMTFSEPEMTFQHRRSRNFIE